MGQFNGKTVIITGAGQGIGLGIAKAFAREGANLTLTGRTESKLINAKKELEKIGGTKILTVRADGSSESAVQNVIDKTIETYGRIDVVINNAQASKSGVLLENHSKADFDLAIQTGLYGTFYYMRAAFPHLKETRGSVINFASGAGLAGKAGQASYAAAKEGIRGLSRVAATEWGQYGINVNVVCPLAMTEGLKKWREEYPALYDQTIRNIPMRRFADPETDVGRVCVFLASDDAKFITGETVSVQGGGGLRP